MIYKRTYQFCTIILLGGMGLLLFNNTLQSSQFNTERQRMITSIEVNNKILATTIDKTVDRASESIKKKPTYKRLLPPMWRVQELTEKFNSFLDTKKKVLQESSNLDLWSRYQLLKKTQESVNLKLAAFHENMKEILHSTAKNRNLGIKPAELAELAEKQDSYLQEGISLPVFALSKDDSNLQWELTHLKNKILLASVMITNYLGSKIGSTTICGFSRPIVIAFPNNTVIEAGETYETSFRLAVIGSRTMTVSTIIDIVSVKVDGIDLTKGEYGFTYRKKSNIIGEHQYTAEISIKNPFTGKIDNFKRKFSYYVK